jgi:hypothetical protein
VSPFRRLKIVREGCFAANRGSILLGADRHRVRCRLWRIAATVLAVMAAGSLCACGGGSIVPSGSLFSSSIFGGSTKMVLSPVIGPPAKLAQELTDNLVAAGKERNLTLLTSGTADYTMRGYLAASTDKKGATISYIWDVSDAKGQRVVRVSGEEVITARSGSDPWNGVDSTALRSIAGKSTSQIVAALPKGGSSGGTASSSPPSSPPPGSSPTATAKPAPPGEVMAIVAPVSGAPGDGQSSLTAALKKRLYAGGVKLAGGSGSNGRNVYTIKGNVSLTDATGGKQNIRIDWQVLDPSGKSLGTVSQQNMIPKGSLSGPWGAIADAAAGAAADGIIKLLPRSSS